MSFGSARVYRNLRELARESTFINCYLDTTLAVGGLHVRKGMIKILVCVRLDQLWNQEPGVFISSTRDSGPQEHAGPIIDQRLAL